ncbi:adhesion G-protein coupled receptor G4 [Thalassophryne amazonica]|uniref:adhesion G-protein coupled receptor G4 n=1 Tax=Thalassophryne amazonica TaxID=390379 RepID=UPI001472041D|nr:adhesion G-protein coupled receptor G4 [Thalassophryne amazonica]
MSQSADDWPAQTALCCLLLHVTMKSIRSLFLLTICLCMLLSVGLLPPVTSGSTSLWGKKVIFKRYLCLWQLQPQVMIPALEELTVCMQLKRSIESDFTAFEYKAPGGVYTELGIGGNNTHLFARLFGKEWDIAVELHLDQWHLICLTWSNETHRLHLYVNGSSYFSADLNSNPTQQLILNGTLTLGISHYVDKNGQVQQVYGKTLIGEIGLFRIWAREWHAEDLGRHSCADGDVVSWDKRQWKNTCNLKDDKSMECVWSDYEIKMWTYISHSTNLGNFTLSLEESMRHWLEKIFPKNISINNVFVSSPSHTCHVVKDSSALHLQHHQGSRPLLNSTRDKCFIWQVYVNVDPAANIAVVQSSIAALLNLTFQNDFLNLTVDLNNLSILPVDAFPVMTEPMSTASSGTSASIVGQNRFFRVNILLTMTSSPTDPKEMINKWLKETLEVNGTMVVLNLFINMNTARSVERDNGLKLAHGHQKQYNCTFHVQESVIASVEESEKIIYEALKLKYENNSVVIETVDVVLKHIVPRNCLEETTSTIYGIYMWPEAFPQITQEMGCIEPISEIAYRLCKLDIHTDMTSWADPDMTRCKPTMTISDLKNITVSTDNMAEVVDMIEDVVDTELGSNAALSPSELDTVVQKLNEVVEISDITPAVGGDVVNIVARILFSDTDVTPVAGIVLNLTEKLGDNMYFQNESISLIAPSLALSMVNVDRNTYKGLTFGASSTLSNSHPQVLIKHNFESGPLPDTNATISLPTVLHITFPADKIKTRVQFQFYGTEDLFKDRQSTNTSQCNWTVNSYIVSASINNSYVINLKDRVVVTLSHQKPKKPDDKVRCMFWDFQKNGGQGGWNSNGCETWNNSSHQTSCLCDHLTHFAVLLDVARAPISAANTHILTVISYIGCGVSSIFLGLTLLSYVVFEKLRRDYPAKILINLSAALLGLNMLFLLNPWLSSFSTYELCISTAAALHYFLLASFTWMGLEAVHIYIALVQVFNTYIPSYILKCCTIGWGLPIVIVSLVLAIDKDAYGILVYEDEAGEQSTEVFCWIQSNVFFYVTVVTIALLILLCNICVFIVVLIQIKRMNINKPSGNQSNILHDLRAAASITVLLGLTWSVSFLAVGPGRVVLMYLFAILNTFQGFFIFLFHCLMKENVRKQWRIHLCCGRFRPDYYSDWSRSVTAGGKRNHLVNCDSLAYNTCSIRKGCHPATRPYNQ